MLRYQLYRLTRRSEPQQEEEILPSYKYRPTDRFRFAVQVNQDGYLYVIRQPRPNSNGSIVYPSGVNERGRAQRETWMRIPDCGRRLFDCQYVLTAGERAETFIIVFSRRVIPQLAGLTPGVAAISPEEIRRLTNESAQDVERRQGLSGMRFAIELKNKRKEDDRIAEKVPIQQTG